MQERTPLHELLVERLRRSGPVPFESYMQECLYHPQHGYYTRGGERTGAGGDYFTSSDLHPVFARLIGRQAAEMWEALGRPARFEWVELGAGRGLFAEEFLDWARRERPDFSAALAYIGVEPGEAVRQRIAERLARSKLSARARLAASLGEVAPLTGCFFSNELVDALPVAVVTRRGGRLREIYVEAEGGELREKPGPLHDAEIAAAVARYSPELEEGCRVEVNLYAGRLAREWAEKLARGFALTIDYGDVAGRLYTADRPRGTLLAYRGHQTSENVFEAPGEQDLTAHVNFSALMDAGQAAGLETTGFTTQERFLMALGEANAFGDLCLPGENEVQRLDARLKLKRLISPAGMGQVFKVLVQHRGLAVPALTGLKFQRAYEAPRASGPLA
jgi:SAM-dependent MidA family methyltransferase